MNCTHRAVVLVLLACGVSLAQDVRRIPPPGVRIPDADRQALQAGLQELLAQVQLLRQSAAKSPAVAELLPDVEIYSSAVRYALTYDEFFKTDEVAKAKKLLNEGMERAKSLREGQAPWTKAAGLVVRGYVSKIDGSVQPYGLVLPESVATDTDRRRRLDIWYHGRGETLSEVNFLSDRERNRGEFTPPDTIVLHPYGRYCNANRFAGEVDTFEALDNVRKHYAVDEDRILVRGFSMGGAACWTFATHHAGLWAGAAPGAGFSETAGFLHINDLSAVPWYQQKLWHLYDSTDYAINLFNCPTVAYSGEIDAQKQAADMMAKAIAEQGMTLEHVIGPGTRHQYHPQAKPEIDRRMNEIARRGRNPVPSHVKFTTWTLRYNRMLWVQVDGLEHHWERANVEAEIVGPQVQATTQNVTALTLAMPSGYCPLDITHDPRVIIDHQSLTAPRPFSDRSWVAHFRKSGAQWSIVDSTDDSLRKRHGLQGPIDDAFYDSFIMVKPSGQPLHEKTGQWAAAEMAHAVEHWRRQFRGDAPVKEDNDLTDADIASSNLVLWGDASSNSVIKKVIDKLPIKWEAQALRIGDKSYAAETHMPVMIYPNPLNPRRYVVLNSGFTFREYDYENNARQTPKLPDWAVIDVTSPPTPRAPGGIADAGFFDEQWRYSPARAE